MIEAAERQRIAFLLAHHHGATMWAGVEEGADGAAAIAIEDELAAAHGTRDEVAGVADLRAVAEIEPAAVEDLPALLLEDLLVGEGAAGDAEQMPLRSSTTMSELVRGNPGFGTVMSIASSIPTIRRIYLTLVRNYISPPDLWSTIQARH